MKGRAGTSIKPGRKIDEGNGKGIRTKRTGRKTDEGTGIESNFQNGIKTKENMFIGRKNVVVVLGPTFQIGVVIGRKIGSLELRFF